MTNIIMKLHLLVTAPLAVAPGVVFADMCPDNQIPCDISSDADCRRQRDRTSRACETTWSKGCCLRDCQPTIDGRVCKIAPPSEDYFGLFGFADIEDYAGDEDSEEFDSEDLATEISADSEDEDEDSGSGSEDADFEDSEDMIFYSGTCYYGGWIRTSRDLSICCRDEFDDCKDDKNRGFSVPNCARQRQQCGNQDRLVQVPYYAGDEDSEEFDSEDLATEISADSEDEDSGSEDADFEDSEDMIFYSGTCYYGGWSNGGSIRTSRDLSICCRDEFDDCKYDKNRGFSVPNCARQRQQCGNQDRLVQVA